MPEVVVFISHSSRDQAAVSALAELIQQALALNRDAIRCSSAQGFEPRIGQEFDECIRTEVWQAKAFVALLTPDSLTSDWVLTEMGARWGARLEVLPVLACGSTSDDLTGPFRRITGVSAYDEHAVNRLLHDLGNRIGRPTLPAHRYSSELKRFVRAANNHNRQVAVDTRERGALVENSPPPDLASPSAATLVTPVTTGWEVGIEYKLDESTQAEWERIEKVFARSFPQIAAFSTFLGSRPEGRIFFSWIPTGLPNSFTVRMDGFYTEHLPLRNSPGTWLMSWAIEGESVGPVTSEGDVNFPLRFHQLGLGEHLQLSARLAVSSGKIHSEPFDVQSRGITIATVRVTRPI